MDVSGKVTASGIWLDGAHVFLRVGEHAEGGQAEEMAISGCSTIMECVWVKVRHCWLWLWTLMRVKLGGHFLGRHLKVLPMNTPALFHVTIRHGQIVTGLTEAVFPTNCGW